jgi:hypothetical protein
MEEVKQAEQPTESTQEEPKGPSNKEIRESKLFLNATKQLAELQQKVAAYEQTEAERAQVVEIEKAKASQTLEQLVAQKDAEITNLRKSYEAQQIEASIRVAAIRAGAKSDVLIDGLVAQWSRLQEKPESVDDWVGGIARSEEHAPLFQSSPGHASISAGPSARAASRSGVDSSDLVARVRGGVGTPEQRSKDIAELKKKIATGEIARDILSR